MDSLGIHAPSGAGLREEVRVTSLRRDLAHGDPAAAAEKLEALFATMLVKEMRRSLPNGFFGEGSGADTYNGWFDEHLGAALARSGALDLAGMVKTSLGAGPEMGNPS